MIFVTVGTQLPFDRLVGAVDRWAQSQGRRDVFAQVGPTTAPTRFIQSKAFIDAAEFQTRCEEAELIVAHLGMGSIITALELGKPILVLPRLASLKEHRNDHQLAMARRLHNSDRICVARDEADLVERLSSKALIEPAAQRRGTSSPSVTTAISRFIRGDFFDGSAFPVNHPLSELSPTVD